MTLSHLNSFFMQNQIQFIQFCCNLDAGEWRQMSLPAMLVGETVIEILQASQFAREIVSKVDTKTTTEDPKTPLLKRSNQELDTEFNTQLKARRKKEKQNKQQDSESPPQVPLQRARSRINFKVSPPKIRSFDKEKENNKYLANRVSPRNRPWATKTVLFPNPLFSSTSSSHQQHFCKTRSPVISRNRETTTKTPHKFVIMSPQAKGSKFQVKVKTPPLVVSSISSPVRPTTRLSSPPKRSKLSRHFSPSKLVATPSKSKKTVQKSDGLMCLSKSSPKRSAASKLRRSFSPSRLVTRLVSPLKGKKTVQKSDGLVSGLKQRPTLTTHFPAPRFKNIL